MVLNPSIIADHPSLVYHNTLDIMGYYEQLLLTDHIHMTSGTVT